MANQRKRKTRWWWWTGAAVVVVGVLAAVVAARGSHTKIEPARLAKVTRGDIAKSVIATGKIQPITKIELKSKASGIVEKLYVDINQQVHKAQVLAQLDQQEILAQVAAQKAQLAAAEANVITYKANIAEDKVNAQAPDLPMYQQTYQRNLEMEKQGIVSQQTLDNAERDYLANKNKQQSSAAQIFVDDAKLKQAEAQVQQNQASLEQLNEQLSYTTLVSPIDGVVLSRDVEVGDAVSSILVLGSTATQVMTIGDTTQVYVDGKVDEADIGSVYLGQPARIRVESFQNEVFNGKVTKIAPLGVEKDNVTTFQVRVSIDNPKNELKANMTANAEVLIKEDKAVLSVPEQALVYDAQKNASVFVPDAKEKDGQRKIPVKAGISNGSRTEILDGLKEGDTVVLQQ
ncbi:HlyD family secretion protein [Silvibacterium bohemicum]|uniref:HlyD family secretion protein n=1 Tax=Silvibacterium bohemicum TaxID=1577686 RepID=A0A841JSH4_9BACT|nr:efflux RND transporter periplasmic adaptor subunit [Silvibacterium bohemicum]MBB6142719.1 HlyD family secretion protein [Silvibacterium bohemicum]